MTEQIEAAAPAPAPASPSPSPLAVILGVAFSRALNEDLGGAMLKQAVQRNREETDPAVCHTNDFCDANMLMQHAFDTLGLTLFGPSGHIAGRTMALWNEAWACAKAADFKVEPVHAGYTQAELRAALDLVKNPKGWKMPVNKRLPTGVATEPILDRIRAALVFFCGSPCNFQQTTQGVRVTAPGYYACIGS